MGGAVGGTGKRLRELAETLFDGNKSELARAVDMKPGSFSKYIRGARKPGARVLQRLTRLGVNLNWFVTGDGPMFMEDGSATQAPSPVSALGDDLDDLPATVTIAGEQFHRVPLVQPREDEQKAIQFDEIGESEWLSHTFIRRQYAVDPDQLREFRVTRNHLAQTIRAGDRVRGALVPPDSPPTDLIEGAAFLLLGPSGMTIRRLFRDEELLLRDDHPDVDDVHLDPEQWTTDYRPVARLLEVVHPL